MLLAQRADQWRMTQTANKKLPKVRRRQIPVLIIPITDVDAVESFAQESTHMALVHRSLRDLRKDDELRLSRTVNTADQVVQDAYIVVGIRNFAHFGLRHREAFVKQLT